MSEIEFENQLRSIASDMEYPRTPDIAGVVMARLLTSPAHSRRVMKGGGRPRFALKRLAWSLTIILVLLSSLMLIPTARAAIIEFIQIGIVRIFPEPTQPPMDEISTPTPVADFPSLIPMLDMIAGETELANAQQIASYPILLPTYPSDLGRPNHVYVQDVEGVMTILDTVGEFKLHPKRAPARMGTGPTLRRPKFWF
ncbi:MAG TPA: hypothetical protein VIS72_03725 [Anaerolineales bacterium]